MPVLDFDAYVGAVMFDRSGRIWFALGDGSVRDDAGGVWPVHQDAILSAAPHPSGEGILTGGQDGGVVWTRPTGQDTLYSRPGRWIDALAANATSGLWALATGRTVEVRDRADPDFARSFTQARSAPALAFDPKGRRLAVATYGGVTLWYARIAQQTPQTLTWAGSHIEVAWSPDGRFLISAMQENALHGWRLADGKDMRMGGYPTKVRSLAFLAKSRAMATSGAAGAVVWPFAGADGPMGKSAAELDALDGSFVTRVAAADGERLVMGRSDGSVRVADLTSGEIRQLAPANETPVSALAVSPDCHRGAYGTEAGLAGVFSL